ncbi:MAG: ABC transporter substrate-binding protein, partial [Desulfobacca sp.]|nr:ABC transporter substrate-binding protein [Desulfobacca sp.]
MLGVCLLALLTLSLSWGGATSAIGAEEKPIKIGIVTFLSGGAAGPFGVPARNGAEVLVETLNLGGKVPAPYAVKGFGGAPIELVFIDEAGGVTKQVTEFRNLVQRQNVDLVIGYISSGDAIAIPPVAEELKKLTVIFDAGTPRVFEDGSYKYVFRTGAHATMDNVAAAYYVMENKPKTKKFAGINQNYAWGQDSWNDFEAALKALNPGAQLVVSQMPKLMAGQYGAEISSLLSSGADVVHSSFWGGDLEAFVLQAVPRGLFKKSTVILTAGETAMFRLGKQIPEGTIIGGRGPHGVFAPDNELNRWFRKAYQERYALFPTYPAYKMVQAILGVKAAYEKAMAAAGGKAPTQDQIIAALEYLTYETPSGKVEMAIGKGHQAIQGTAYGTVKHVKGQLVIANVKQYPAA